MLILPHSDQFTAVLVGNFNPAIFSPSWLALNKLVSVSDSEKAGDVVVHSQFFQFKVGDLSLSGDKDRFSVACLSSVQQLAHDLLLSIFGSILPHSPIMALGINREVHFDVQTAAVRDAVGNALAPKEPWGMWAADISNPDPAMGNGVASITMNHVRSGKSFPGHIQATVQPSVLEPIRGHGIYMAINNHYDLKANSVHSPVEQLLRIGEEEWQAAFEKSAVIVDQIQSLALRIKEDARSKSR